MTSGHASAAAPDAGAGTERPAGEVPWTHTLFQQPWWLDALAPGRWSEVRVSDGDQVVGRLPYVLRERAGLTSIAQPPMTQSLGPWVAIDPAAKQARRLSTEKHVMGELIAGLPGFSAFHQSFAPQVTNWLPFHWAGFQSTVRYTYRLEDLSDLDAAWDGLSSDHRRKIRKAQREVAITTEPDLGALVDVVTGRMARKRTGVEYDRALLARLDAACATRDARRMFFARDADDRIRGVLYLVWDERAAYYLMGGQHGEVPGDTAVRLLMWEAIRFASSVSRVFDFEGSMIEPIERFFRGFGATQHPYFHVSKVRAGLQPLWALRAWRANRAS